MTYKSEIIKAMKMLSEDEKVIFLGQNTEYGRMYGTLSDIPIDKIKEMPIAEDMQMGISIGLALNGYIPISIYERMDFLILAMNQLINHLDKIEEMSEGIFKPKVIIRTIVGSKKPLNPGLQHSQDYTELLKACLKNINIYVLKDKKDILNSYKEALESEKSSILIEYREYYEGHINSPKF